MRKADAIVIGSGQAGVPLAVRLAEEGLDVVLFERAAYGGSCINYGCIPTKMLLTAAHAAAAARNARKYGIYAEVTVDYAAVIHRIQQRTIENSTAARDRMRAAGVEVVHSEAAFSGRRRVTAHTLSVEAPVIVINTGNRPHVVKLEGLLGTPFLTYQNLWGHVERLPERMVILGGGYTGVEFAQALQRLGSQVTLVEQGERLVSDEEPDVSAALQRALAADGVEVVLETSIRRVAYDDGLFKITLDDDGTLTAEQLLMATGREPNTDSLRLSNVELRQNRKGYLVVDDRFETNVAGVYAVGDVTGQPAFTHVSWEDHRRLLDIILNGDEAERRQGDRPLGYAFFTEPQVGRAGLTLEAAEEAGYDARAVSMPLTEVGRAKISGHENGFYRLVVDRETDKLLGSTLVGPQAAELVHIVLACMNAGASWQNLAESVFIHPTYAEDLPGLARRMAEKDGSNG